MWQIFLITTLLKAKDLFIFSFLEEKVTFGERPFDDVHVLTGALKLYFRELPEPLFPFDSYDDFVDAISKYEEVLKWNSATGVALYVAFN